jgi:hypothetical protein
MPGEELERLLAFVGDAHGVVEEPLVLKRLRVLRRVMRLDLDAALFVTASELLAWSR